MKLVHTAFDVPNAQMIRQLLESNGIEAIVQGSSITAIAAKTPTVYPTVWVANDGDVPRACEILEEYAKESRAPAVRRETWTCRSCGEEIENQFSACWRCTEQMDSPPDLNPERQKLKTALVVALFLGVGCAFLSLFMSNLAGVTTQSPDSARRLGQIASLTRLACILFGIIAMYFIARLANAGRREI